MCACGVLVYIIHILSFFSTLKRKTFCFLFVYRFVVAVIVGGGSTAALYAFPSSHIRFRWLFQFDFQQHWAPPRRTRPISIPASRRNTPFPKISISWPKTFSTCIPFRRPYPSPVFLQRKINLCPRTAKPPHATVNAPRILDPKNVVPQLLASNRK